MIAISRFVITWAEFWLNFRESIAGFQSTVSRVGMCPDKQSIRAGYTRRVTPQYPAGFMFETPEYTHVFIHAHACERSARNRAPRTPEHPIAQIVKSCTNSASRTPAPPGIQARQRTATRSSTRTRRRRRSTWCKCTWTPSDAASRQDV
jgi:hypothetical protein